MVFKKLYGGEIFVPKIKSADLDLARAFSNDAKIKFIGSSR